MMVYGNQSATRLVDSDDHFLCNLEKCSLFVEITNRGL